MHSKFNPGDLVVWENKVFLVSKVLLMNPNIISDPFVCALVPPEKPESYRAVLVREGLLTKHTKAIKVLYGN